MAAEPQDPGTPAASTSRSSRPSDAASPRVTMGLLDYITSHSMDEDYAHVSERRQQQGERASVRPGAAALIILGLFGLLVATAGIQTSRNAAAEEDGRTSLITQINARSVQVDARRERIVEVREEIDTLQQRFLSTTGQGRAISARLDRLGVRTGAVAVTGPGVKVVVDDAPNASSVQEEVLGADLRKLVNALWESGAEAIALNRQRLTNLSAIATANEAITVNNEVSLSPPYVVEAIGDPDSMPARFVETSHGAAWLDLQAVYGLRFEMTSEESMRLPPAEPDRLILRHATRSTR